MSLRISRPRCFYPIPTLQRVPAFLPHGCRVKRHPRHELLAAISHQKENREEKDLRQIPYFNQGQEAILIQRTPRCMDSVAEQFPGPGILRNASLQDKRNAARAARRPTFERLKCSSISAELTTPSPRDITT